jgi:hypothetical protein
MKPATKFAPYRRRTFLETVAVGDRALAERLCALLEGSFETEDIAIYAGFPIVVRDSEWIAGFAMRKSGPIAYCCSPATLAAMAAELKPYMSGKSCIAVRPRRGETIETVLDIVGRAFRTASQHGGMISKADERRRARERSAKSGALVAREVAKKVAREAAQRASTDARGKSRVKSSAKSESTKRAAKPGAKRAAKPGAKRAAKPGTKRANA